MTTLADTTEAPQRWGRVLGEGIAVFLVAGTAGFLGGIPLMLGLVALLAGPEVIPDLPDRYLELPVEVQALASLDGIALCGSLFEVPVGLLLLWRMVPPGLPAREYLGLKWPGLRQGLGWGLLLLFLDFGYEFLIGWLDLPWSGDDRYDQIARAPLLVPLFALSVVVLTPVFEEVLCRGFLLEGFRRSQLGEIGAILMTSTLWAVLHPGGPVRWLGLILYGSFLALARLRTGSTYLAVLIHGIGNLVAVVLMVSR